MTTDKQTTAIAMRKDLYSIQAIADYLDVDWHTAQRWVDPDAYRAKLLQNNKRRGYDTEIKLSEEPVSLPYLSILHDAEPELYRMVPAP